MKISLRHFFPMIQSRQCVLDQINHNSACMLYWQRWTEEQRTLFLDICSGVRGVKMLYDSFFKEIMNPSIYPERLSDLLSQDGTYKNLYKLYKQIKPVYTIILFENSEDTFQQFPDTYIHSFEMKSDTGLQLDLLQRYLFIPLDIFKKNLQTKGIADKLDAWLAFLCCDEPEWIIRIIEAYPVFKPMYQQVYEICLNVEEVMMKFSKELLEMDRETVKYMLDEMREDLVKKYEEGLENGYKKGEAEGYEKGSAEGYEKGSAEGYEKGSADTWNKVQAEISALKAELAALKANKPVS